MASSTPSSSKIPDVGSGHDLSSLSPVERNFITGFLSSGGTISKSISLTTLPGQGRCYIANDDIAEDEELFTIPRHMLLNTTNSLLPELCQAYEARQGVQDVEMNGDASSKQGTRLMWNSLSGWTPLILCMMWEAWRSSEPGRDALTRVLSALEIDHYVPSTSSFADGGLDIKAAAEQGQQWQQTVRPKGEQNWGGYLDILPTDFSNMPMFWSEEMMSELKGTSVPDRIGREEADAEYTNSARPFMVDHAEVFFGPGISKEDAEALLNKHFSLHHFHTQGSRMLSRSFHVKREHTQEVKEGLPVGADMSISREDEAESDEEQADDSDDEGDEEKEDLEDISMVPMADMLNASYASDNARLYYYDLTLNMRASRAIKRGEQVLNTYGDPPNADLLRRYGYVDSWNGADEAELAAAILVDAVLQSEGLPPRSTQESVSRRKEALMSRVAFLAALGLEESFVLNYPFQPSETSPHRPTPSTPSDKEIKQAIGGGVLDEELLSAARTLLLSEGEFDKYREKNKIPKPRLDEDVADLLLVAIRRRLELYAGGATTGEDEKRIYSSKGEPLEVDPSNAVEVNRRNAILVRLGEKRVLEANAMLLKRMLQIKKNEAREAAKASTKQANGKRKVGSSAATDGSKKKRK